MNHLLDDPEEVKELQKKREQQAEKSYNPEDPQYVLYATHVCVCVWVSIHYLYVYKLILFRFHYDPSAYYDMLNKQKQWNEKYKKDSGKCFLSWLAIN